MFDFQEFYNKISVNFGIKILIIVVQFKLLKSLINKLLLTK